MAILQTTSSVEPRAKLAAWDHPSSTMARWIASSRAAMTFSRGLNSKCQLCPSLIRRNK